ncbi:SDR family NAD(P)-dependent oxidoreductase [Parapedobacter sp. 10938]|uniref:SDR family NAD(P)-dependent oxidoreductase n=1 Tax=Parapedobacter flavus TaxID=3110225 RepID=UPI002DBD3F08|nr:SDR family NAD(P)-dependent oxidoreductase [Parapedobacter sp. 10938]MEC3881388.1 SDR family NAD(P)-dependent oxidoreductase [Parapedobacter sp. 10938]
MTSKKIIIIGATSGIGHAVAEVFATEGHIVGITGRREALLREMADARPTSYHTVAFDVTAVATSITHLAALATAMGGVDTIVISAGGGDTNAALDFDIEQRMIDLNVRAFTQLADWAFNYFKAQGRGHLAAITSVAGMRGSRQAPGYSASKAYQINYLQGLRQKAYKEQLDIAVTDLCPGFVDTPMAKSPTRFWVAPVDKAARQIYRGLQKRRHVVYVTRRWRGVAWLYRVLPGWLHQRL